MLIFTQSTNIDFNQVVASCVGSHMLNYIFISANSLSVPLGPCMPVSEFCRALGRESCSHPVPTYCASVCVMGTLRKPGWFQVNLSWSICSGSLVCALQLLMDFSFVASCLELKQSLSNVWGWIWGSQHHFALLIDALLSSALCRYRQILFLLKP